MPKENMIGTSEKRRLTFEQAARWFLWLRDHKADPAKVDVFQRWCSSSVRNRRAYEKVEHLWQACNGIDPLDLPWPTELELEQDQYDGSYALPLPNRAGAFVLGQSSTHSLAQQFRLNRQWLNWRMAASVCVTALLIAFTVPKMVEWATGSSPHFATTVAQQRVEVLKDGSIITLGGATRLSVQYNAEERLVVLEQGEAFFEVAKDKDRPFTVLVGNSEVRAVGTAFNINRRVDAVTVSVVEGMVDVSKNITADSVKVKNIEIGKPGLRHERLSKGQELVFSREGELWQARQDNSLERATAWREGRLAYVNERLDQVLQDINRYSPQKVVIGDWELGNLRYTGTVFSKDIGSWLKGLEQAFALRTLTVDDRKVLVKDTSKQT
ncbi:MAG: FecR domain-containing protein [Gammaproteobacteria bacterium]|nr:FecR domain-containing protein [Gammaproteobacteria bacterium]